VEIKKDEIVMIKLDINESYDNLSKRIYAFLDEEGGYTDYNQKIEDVEEEFGLSKEEAESYVWNWASGLYKNDIDENYLSETSDWHTNPNVEDVFVNDVFVDSRGNKVKIVKVNKDDFTVVNLDTDIVSKIRKDYLINHFELMDEDYLAETQAYNLDNSESRRKEIADRFGRTFTPDDHILVCKDGKKLNIQVGKKYKCTACNGQRVEIVSIDDIYTDDRGDTASITAYYRGKLIMVGSTQLYESIHRKRSVKESYRNNWGRDRH